MPLSDQDPQRGVRERRVQTGHRLTSPAWAFLADPRTSAAASSIGSLWGIRDYIKTPVVNFNGYGHISHDYVKVDGQWKIIRLHTTRMIVDEQWLTDATSAA
jgi:hypothetical protein